MNYFGSSVLPYDIGIIVLQQDLYQLKNEPQISVLLILLVTPLFWMSIRHAIPKIDINEIFVKLDIKSENKFFYGTIL